MPYDFTHMRRQKKKQMSKQGKTNKQTNKQKKNPHRYSEQLVVTRGKGGQGGGGGHMVKGVNCVVIGGN